MQIEKWEMLTADLALVLAVAGTTHHLLLTKLLPLCFFTKRTHLGIIPRIANGRQQARGNGERLERLERQTEREAAGKTCLPGGR